MKTSTLTRHLREGGKNVFRNGWMTFASVSSISISLFILGLFLVLGINLNDMSKQIESQVTITAYLQLSASDEERIQVENEIRSLPDVKSVKYVSKEQALIEMRETMGNDLEGLEGENNPLPDAFIVEVKEPENIKAVTEQIEALNTGKEAPPIESVKYGEKTIDTLFKVTRIARYVGLVFVVSLIFTSMFLISNTIKLTILARSREIRIMKLVGATNGFIRWPFFIEGALIGFLGALIPTAVIVYGYQILYDLSQPVLATIMLKLTPFKDIAYPVTGLLMIIGLGIGIWGSVISVRKFLKV